MLLSPSGNCSDSMPHNSHSLTRNRSHTKQTGLIFSSKSKYGIVSVMTCDDEKGTSPETQSEGVSVLRGHNLYI